MFWRELEGQELKSKEKSSERHLLTGATAEGKGNKNLEVGNKAELGVVSCQGAWRSVKKMVEFGVE